MNPRAQKRLLLAEDARDARARLDRTVAQVRNRLTPRAIVSEAAELITARAGRAAETATSEARKRPLLIGAGAVAAVLAIAVRLGFRPWRRETKMEDDRSTSRLENE